MDDALVSAVVSVREEGFPTLGKRCWVHGKPFFWGRGRRVSVNDTYVTTCTVSKDGEGFLKKEAGRNYFSWGGDTKRTFNHCGFTWISERTRCTHTYSYRVANPGRSRCNMRGEDQASGRKGDRDKGSGGGRRGKTYQVTIKARRERACRVPFIVSL